MISLHKQPNQAQDPEVFPSVTLRRLIVSQQYSCCTVNVYE